MQKKKENDEAQRDKERKRKKLEKEYAPDERNNK